MATWDYPDEFIPQQMEWRSIKAAVQNKSVITGATESIEFPAERFGWNITLPQSVMANGARAQAFFGRISGGIERVRMRCWTRPMPRGTMRGTPTLAVAASRGQQQLVLSTSGTLQAGDLFKVGSQVFMVFMDCAPVSGQLTVPLMHRVRGPLAAGMAVEWDRPTWLATIPAASSSATYSPGAVAGMSIELLESFAS